MYRPMPPIVETADELQHQMYQEPHPHKRQCLRMLYLIVSEQATTRSALAPLLGVNRETVGDWLRRYEMGGLAHLLTIAAPAGKQPILHDSAVLQDVEALLTHPTGVASYAEIRDWLAQKHGITINVKTLGNFLRRRFGTRSHVVRLQEPAAGNHPTRSAAEHIRDTGRNADP